jgi:hypothetical protein
MCLLFQACPDNKSRCLDERVPAPEPGSTEPGRQSAGADAMTDGSGQNYVAVSICELERFSAK